VNVRCTSLDGVQQNFINKPNYGRVFDIVAAYFFLLVIITRYIKILEIEIIVIKPGHAGVDCFDRPCNALFKLVLLYDIKFATSLRVEPVVVEQDKLEERITKAIEAVDTSMSGLDDDDFDLENLDVTSDEDEQEEDRRDDVEDAPVVRFVNKVLLDAIKRGASDVHFEPYEKLFRVRTRLDGVLSEVATPPVILATKVCARLKVMSRMDIGWTYQDAAIQKPCHRLSCKYLSNTVR